MPAGAHWLCFGDDPTSTTLLERLKAAPPTASVPVLAGSAHHTLLKGWHDQRVAWDCGNLLNSFNLEDLLTAVRTGLATRETSMASVRGERWAAGSVGATIKACRRELGWSQEELAERVATRGD